MRVYVSSTYADLVEFREAVYDALRRLRYDVVAMEDYVATDTRPLEKCVEDVAASDIYVGLIAWRYGFVPPDTEQSITELEYEAAGAREIPQLMFLAKEGIDWPSEFRETGAGKVRLDAFRERLQGTHIVNFFASPDDLATKVATSVAVHSRQKLEAALAALRSDQEEAARTAAAPEGERVVNEPPVIVSNFRDRVEQQRELLEFLEASDIRMVAVLGRSGIGKSALVTYVLGNGQDATPSARASVHSILWLSSRRTKLSLERISTDVGKLLGASAQRALAEVWAKPDTTLRERCRAMLTQFESAGDVIVLDGLEQVLGPDGAIADEGLRLFVEECLAVASGPRLIVVSRETTRIPPTALARMRTVRLDAGLPREDAVAFLKDLDPQGAFGLSDATPEDLRRAVELARGIPRALQIVAGMLRDDETATLADLLEDDALAQLTAEALVAEGYRRLDQDARRVLGVLAVLERDVPRAAVEYMLVPWFPGLDVRACLNRLSRRNFVDFNRSTKTLTIQPMDREYAHGRLTTADASATPVLEGLQGVPPWTLRALELRAADFYASTRVDKAHWRSIDDVAPQLAEFEHSMRAGAPARAARVLDAIEDDYLFLWGHYAMLTEMRTRLLDAPLTPAEQAANCGRLALVCQVVGDHDNAERHYKAAVDHAREAGDRAAEGRWVGNLGRHYRNLGQMDEALDHSQPALDIAIEVGEQREIGFRRDRLGLVLRNLGRLEEARAEHQKANDIAVQVESPRDIGASASNIGWVERLLGNYDASEKYCLQALAIDEEINDRRGVAIINARLGAVALARRAFADARERFEASLDEADKLELDRERSEALLGLGRADLGEGRTTDAVALLTRALALDVKSTAYRVAAVLGVAHAGVGDEVAARAAFEEAARRADELLAGSVDMFEALYAKAVARAGLAVLDPRWADEQQRTTLLAPATETLRAGIDACAARGVLDAAHADLAWLDQARPGLRPLLASLSEERDASSE